MRVSDPEQAGVEQGTPGQILQQVGPGYLAGPARSVEVVCQHRAVVVRQVDPYLVCAAGKDAYGQKSEVFVGRDCAP